MPGNLHFFDTTLPRAADANGKSAEEQLSGIYNYLYMLLEQLRYTLSNLDISNFNKAGLSEITSPIFARIEGAEGKVADLQLTADGLAGRISDSEGNIEDLQLTAQGLLSRVSSAEGNVSYLQQQSGSLIASVSSLQSAQSTTLFLDPSGLVVMGNGGSVSIHGSQLMAGTVVADEVDANAVLADGIELNGLLHVPGMGYLGGRSSINNGAVIVSENFRAGCLAGAVSAALIFDDYKIWVQYDGCYTNDPNGVSVYSDRRMKRDIRYDLARYDAFFDALRPASFLFCEDKTEKRKLGLIAQEVKDAVSEGELSEDDFSGIRYLAEQDRYCLSYEQFIALLIDQIQRVKKRVEELEHGK